VPGRSQQFSAGAVDRVRGEPEPRAAIVPGVRKLKLASARTVLSQLGCTVHVNHKYSSVAKGLVISASKGLGTYPYHQVVTLTVSSGRKPKKRKRG
jgi:hypothetical protein